MKIAVMGEIHQDGWKILKDNNDIDSIMFSHVYPLSVNKDDRKT